MEDELVRCSVCLCIYRRPHTLPCLHTFCQPCVWQMTDNWHQVVCPLCREVCSHRMIKHDFRMEKVIAFYTRVTHRSILDGPSRSRGASSQHLELLEQSSNDAYEETALFMYHLQKQQPKPPLTRSHSDMDICHLRQFPRYDSESSLLSEYTPFDTLVENLTPIGRLVGQQRQNLMRVFPRVKSSMLSHLSRVPNVLQSLHLTSQNFFSFLAPKVQKAAHQTWYFAPKVHTALCHMIRAVHGAHRRFLVPYATRMHQRHCTYCCNTLSYQKPLENKASSSSCCSTSVSKTSAITDATFCTAFTTYPAPDSQQPALTTHSGPDSQLPKTVSSEAVVPCPDNDVEIVVNKISREVFILLVLLYISSYIPSDHVPGN